MNTRTLKAILATLFTVIGTAYADEKPSRLYEEYMVKRQHYDERVTAARRDFLALGRGVLWRHVVTRPLTMKERGQRESYYLVESHIEPMGKTKALVKRYTPDEIVAGLYPLIPPQKQPEGVLEIPSYMRNVGERKRIAAVIAAATGENIYSETFGEWQVDRVLNVPPEKTHFSGFPDTEQIRVECSVLTPSQIAATTNRVTDAKQRDILSKSAQMVLNGEIDPAQRRLEYADAIIRILADPSLRTENPLEYQNLRGILRRILKENEDTLQHIEDFRHSHADLTADQISAIDEIISAIESKQY